LANDPFKKWRVDSPIPKESPESSDPFKKWRVNAPAPVPAPLPSEHSRSFGKAALRQVGRLGRAGATGIAGIADIPNLAAMGLHAAGLKEKPTFYEPVAGRVQKAVTPHLESMIGENLAPENKAEEYADVITEGLAPLALGPLTGGASLTGVAARGLAARGSNVASKIAKVGSKPYALTGSNVAGNIGASTAIKTYLDEGGDPNLLGPLLAGLVGGTGARAALKLKNPMNAAAEGVGRITGFSPEKYARNVELGLPVTPATVSKSILPVAKYIEMAAAKMPGSMGPLEDFYKNRESSIARTLGVSMPEDLEQTLKHIPKNLAKEGASAYHERAQNIYKNREKKFKPREEQAIKNKEMVDVSDIITNLENKRLLSLTPSAQKRFDKSKEGILLKELKESIPQAADTTIIDSLRKQGFSDNVIEKILKSEKGISSSPKNGLGLHDLNELREKALHESLASQTPMGGGTPESRKAAMRSQALAEKRHQFMEEIGSPVEIHNARQARKFWSQYKNEDKGMSYYVEKITGSKDDSQAFQKLTSSNPKYLNVARQGLSKKDRPKLAQAIITDLGERQGKFNINTAYTGFTRLEEPVKREFLKTLPNKATAKNFEQMMKFIGENKRMMDKLANTSNTAHTNQVIELFKKYGIAVGAAATGYEFMPLTALLAAYGGLNVGANLWTNQNFLKRMNDTITASNLKSQSNKLDLLFKSINQAGRHSELSKDKTR
jgi:hypothetical protein